MQKPPHLQLMETELVNNQIIQYLLKIDWVSNASILSKRDCTIRWNIIAEIPMIIFPYHSGMEIYSNDIFPEIWLDLFRYFLL